MKLATKKDAQIAVKKNNPSDGEWHKVEETLRDEARRLRTIANAIEEGLDDLILAGLWS